MRCFLAIDIPAKARIEAAEAQKKFSGITDSIRIVKPDNIHLTLKFLGNIDEHVKAKLVQLMKSRLENERPFTAALRGCGVYPRPSYPRIVWLGFNDTGETAALQSKIDKGISPLGFSAEKRRFTAHVTIARVNSMRAMGEIMSIVKHLNTFKGTPFTVNEVKLKSSTLTPLGPVYSDVEVFRLNQE